MLATQTQTTASYTFNAGATPASDEVRNPGKVAPEVVLLNRVNLRTFIVNMDGKFVSVDYVKGDASTRTLTGRLGVKKFLKGGSNKVEAADRPYLTMFDIQLRQYRTVNLASVSEVRALGRIYRVID